MRSLAVAMAMVLVCLVGGSSEALADTAVEKARARYRVIKAELDRQRARLQALNSRISEGRKAGRSVSHLENQAYLLRAHIRGLERKLVRVNREICNPPMRRKHRRRRRAGPATTGPRKLRGTRGPQGPQGPRGPGIRKVNLKIGKPGTKPGTVLKDEVLTIKLPRAREVRKLKLYCPKSGRIKVRFDRKTETLHLGICQPIRKVTAHCRKDRRLGVKYYPKTGRLALAICHGRDGRGIKKVKIVELPPGDKPRTELKDGVLTMYLPRAKPGEPDKSDRWLPRWLKVHVGGFYLLTHGLRHNFGGQLGLTFVLFPKRLDLTFEGGIGYEPAFERLAVYAEGYLDINLHPIVGITAGMLGLWNLNRSNLADYQLLGGTIGVRLLFVKHLRLHLAAILGERKWTRYGPPAVLRREFGAGGKLTISYQF